MVRDGHHWNATRDGSVEIDEVGVEWSVVRRDHWKVRKRTRIERPHERMVVHDIDVLEITVCVSDMADLVDAVPDANADGFVENKGLIDRAGAIPGGAQENVVPGVLQPPGECVENVLGTPIGAGRDGKPRRRHDGDAHASLSKGKNVDWGQSTPSRCCRYFGDSPDFKRANRLGTLGKQGETDQNHPSTSVERRHNDSV